MKTFMIMEKPVVLDIASVLEQLGIDKAKYEVFINRDTLLVQTVSMESTDEPVIPSIAPPSQV